METGVLTSRYRDMSRDRSTYIKIQTKRWRQEFLHRGAKIWVQTGVFTLSYRDKGGDRSTHIEVQRKGEDKRTHIEIQR